MKQVAIIPARWESSRFPGKPLALLKGQPMIYHVYQRALSISGVAGVYVATDSDKIKTAVEAFGGQVLMTRSDHPSGSDRLAEACDLLQLADQDIILNIQGDQPAFNPAHPAMLGAPLMADPTLEMATLALPLNNDDEIQNPNHVKVVFGQNNLALYFSRAPIPWPRDGRGHGEQYYKHIGLYAYRAGFLRKFVTMPPGKLETVEKLEQLRALENGARIKVLIASGLSPEVDTPQDLIAAEAAL